jgi:hypothetical protein
MTTCCPGLTRQSSIREYSSPWGPSIFGPADGPGSLDGSLVAQDSRWAPRLLPPAYGLFGRQLVLGAFGNFSCSCWGPEIPLHRGKFRLINLFFGIQTQLSNRSSPRVTRPLCRKESLSVGHNDRSSVDKAFGHVTGLSFTRRLH